MSLDVTLADIVARLQQKGFPNEQAISQGVVLRVLRELGWDTYDTNVVWPEYQTREGRVDFALCHPSSKPVIFIEVKHVGNAEGAVQQALLYAFQCGVPFVVLTDGRTWSFSLLAEQGDYEERRVYRLDLYERSPSEAAEAFRRYLARENVASGESLAIARTEARRIQENHRNRVANEIEQEQLQYPINELAIGLLARSNHFRQTVAEIANEFDLPLLDEVHGECVTMLLVACLSLRISTLSEVVNEIKESSPRRDEMLDVLGGATAWRGALAVSRR